MDRRAVGIGQVGVKLPTIWTDEKQRRKSEEKVRANRIAGQRRESQKKEDEGAQKGS